MKKKLSTYILVLILISAFALSMWQIDTRSLWLDEGITFYNSGAENLAGVKERVTNLDLSPPAYYYVMHFWQKIAGADTGMFRFLSVIFGLLSVYLVFLIGKKSFNKTVGLIAAFLLAINPFHIGFSQEARMYMMLTFIILLAFYAMLNILTSNNNARWWVLFTASNVIGLLTHNSYFFVYFALGMCLLFFLGTVAKRGQTILSGLVSFLVTAILYLPWLSGLLNQLKVERYWIAPISVTEIKEFIMDFAGGQRLAFYILLGFGVLAFAYLFTFMKKKRFKRYFFSLLVLILFAAVAFWGPILYSLLESHLAKVRYFLFMPALISIVAALGVYSLKKIHFSLCFLPVLALIFIWQPWQVSAFPIEMNEDFREAAKHIESNASEETPVLVHTPSATHVFKFYSKRPALPFPATFDLRNYEISDVDSEYFSNQIKNLNEFWLLITHTHENPQGILRKWSEEKCPQAEEKDFGPIFLLRYKC